MKKSVSDVLRRGFDSTLANWQVVLIRIAESFAIGILVILSLVAIIVPIAVSAGLSKWTAPASASPYEAVMAFLVDHLLLIVWFLSLLLIVIGIAVAIHAFISAGAARTYIDAERKVAGMPVVTRDALAAFNAERFFAEARASWWRVFWIFNATWSVAGLILLIPVLIVAVLLIPAISSDSAGGIIAVSCGGMLLILIVSVPLFLMTVVWTQKAIIVCVSAGSATRDALRTAWQAIRADLLRHALVAGVIIVVSMGVGMLISGALAPFTLLGSRNGDMLGAFLGPPRLMISVVQNGITNGISCWFVAAYAALTEER